MTTAMFDAREVMIPGSVYDRNRSSVNGGTPVTYQVRCYFN